MSKTDLREKFLEVAISNKAYTTRQKLENHLGYMFADVPLAGKQMLDIGGGTGLLTLWAAAQGARAVCLEPESDGSTQDVRKVFENLKSQISPDLKAEMFPDTAQDYLARTNESFDVIVMANCINHLDEESCKILHKDEEARRKYIEFFRVLKAHLNPGGMVISTDCGRRNIFGDLGMRSPIVPNIDWDVHQGPRFWGQLMEQAGMRVVRTQWTTPNSWGRWGQALFGNPIAAYFLFSHFRLVTAA